MAQSIPLEVRGGGRGTHWSRNVLGRHELRKSPRVAVVPIVAIVTIQDRSDATIPLLSELNMCVISGRDSRVGERPLICRTLRICGDRSPMNRRSVEQPAPFTDLHSESRHAISCQSLLPHPATR